MNHVATMDPSKLRTSKGHNETKKPKVGQFLLGEFGHLLYTLNS